MIEVISETQKVGCTSFTSYKVGQKSNIKQNFLLKKYNKQLRKDV